MDNNIPKDSPGFFLTQMLENANKFVDQIKKGDGFGLDEKQKKEFEAQMEEKGANKAIAELDEKMQQLREVVANMNKPK